MGCSLPSVIIDVALTLSDTSDEEVELRTNFQVPGCRMKNKLHVLLRQPVMHVEMLGSFVYAGGLVYLCICVTLLWLDCVSRFPRKLLHNYHQLASPVPFSIGTSD